jgi:hypothetical protein
MQDVQRVLCVRHKVAWNTISQAERKKLDSAYLQIRDEVSNFYLTQVDHHPLIVAGVRYFAKIADRALLWLTRRPPFDDTAPSNRLELLADTPRFFDSFTSLYPTKAAVRTQSSTSDKAP